MTKTVTAVYESEDTLKNVADELVSDAGIPQELVFVDNDKMEVKVVIAAATEGEIRSILERHGPKNLSERQWTE